MKTIVLSAGYYGGEEVETNKQVGEIINHEGCLYRIIDDTQAVYCGEE